MYDIAHNIAYPKNIIRNVTNCMLIHMTVFTNRNKKLVMNTAYIIDINIEGIGLKKEPK